MESLKRNKGPVRILCDEIGVDFNSGMECREVFFEFIKLLLLEIREMMEMEKMISGLGEVDSVFSEVDYEHLDYAECFLNGYDSKISYFSERSNLGCAINTCISALKFSKETPCVSRHAADACNQIWIIKYGVTLFDSHISSCQKVWAAGKLNQAIFNLAFDKRQCS